MQNSPDGHLDLWAREHFKSTIITYAKTIQDVIASHGDNPLPKYKGRDLTFGIFSHTRPIAKSFLRQIKRDLEENVKLKELFPDVLYDNPKSQSPKWGEDDGLIVKRKSNPKEATIEAWGLVDGQPTGKHFTHLMYDDVVVKASVTTPEMIHKTTEAWAESTNLGERVDGKSRYAGTRWAFMDTYSEIISRDVVKPRIYAVTENGKKDGEPVFFTKDQVELAFKKQRDYVFSCQMLLNPKAENADGFDLDWIKQTVYDDHGMNKYLLVDPANEKKKKSDYTVMLVIGLGKDGNYYLLDGIRDRLNITERANCLLALHREWSPIRTGYEKYGMQADIAHIKTVQDRENYRFEILELGGITAKADRIRMLIPLFEERRFWLPNALRKTNYEKRGYCLVQEFLLEYNAFPFMGAGHIDILDCMARIEDNDLGAVHPIAKRRKAAIQSSGGYNPHVW